MSAYGVAIDIAVGGNAKREAVAITAAFEALEKVLLNVDRILGGLRGAGTGLARAGAQAATEWNRAAVAMERSAVAAKQTARETRAAHSGLGTLIAGFAGFEAVKKTFNAEAAVRQAQTALSINGFSPDQIARGNKAAIAVQQSNAGVSQLEALDTLKTLQSITQKPELAIAGLASAEKFAPIFQALGLDVSKAIEAGLKGAEFRGELTSKDAAGNEVFDQKRVDAFLQTASNMAILSGGKVGPEALLTFLRQSGNSGAFSTREGLAAMLPVIQSLNPSQAGTAMQALDQQFSSGKMSDGGYKLGVEMGLFSSNPALARKVGMGQRQLLPGAMDPAAQALERTDKTAFVLDYLRPRIEAYNRLKYGNTYNRGSTDADDQRRLAMDAATAQQLSSRIPGGKGMGDILRNAPQIARDREAMAERMKGGDPATKAIAENPEVQVKAFTAAWTAFEAAWGAAIMGPVVEALKAMTAALNALSDWTRANPEAAKLISETGAALIGLSAGVYAFSKAAAAAKAVLGIASAAGSVPSAVAAAGGGGLGIAGAGIAGAVAAGVVGAANIAGVLSPYKDRDLTPTGEGALRYHGGTAYMAPGGSGGTATIQLSGNVNMDGKKVGSVLANGTTGPNTGTTGFDIRTGFAGSMPLQ